MNVLVIGAGLSGLSAADTLARSGVPVRILEARDRPGGRTLSIAPDAREPTRRVDLGATWGWPHQRHLQQLAGEVRVRLSEQYVTGQLMFDQHPTGVRFDHPSPMTGAFRFEGGAAALSERLTQRLPEGSVTFNTVVSTLNATGTGVQVSGVQDGAPVTFGADAVIIAIPPRLAEHTITFTPALDATLTRVMRATPTWMGFATKVTVTYPTPFWRAQGLSGFGVSHLGPLQEIHDVSPGGGGTGALFGFVGAGAFSEHTSAAARRDAVLGQLARMFGAQAARPDGYFEMNWSREQYSSAPLDRQPLRAHPEYGHPSFLEPALFGRVHWAGAETSLLDGGLLEGAVIAGQRAARRVLASRDGAC